MIRIIKWTIIKRLSFVTVMIILLLLLLVGGVYTINQILQDRWQLLQQTEQIGKVHRAMNREIKRLDNKLIEKETTVLELKKENLKNKRERQILKKVQIIYKHYRDCGTLYSRKDDKENWLRGCDWITPDHLYKYLVLGDKYRYIMDNKKGYWDTLDAENMYICWGANGFNFKVNDNQSIKNKNKTTDWGIMDINDCNLYLFKKIKKDFPYLKGDKFDMESSIAVWFKWQSIQTYESCWAIWSKFRKDVKDLYFKLKDI